MKSNSKRFLSFFVCLFLLAGCLSSTCLAASKTSGKCGKNVKWSYNQKKKTITISGKGKMKNYKDIEDYDYLFKANTPWESKKIEIEEIKIKKGVTYIGECAFSCCNAEKVTIPKTVKKIGAWSFYGCGFQSVTIPEGVTTIGDGAFAWNTDMKSIKIPKSVKKIGGLAVGYSDPMNEEIDEDFIIYGYKNSAAEKYAKKNNIRFKQIK